MEYSHDIAIKVQELSKAYVMIPSPWKKFLYHTFNKKSGQKFWALQDISFDIKKGETFGIIGINGSGKSTLLQIIAGIVQQTAGTIDVNGKVSALLELGSGFNPESTGYENLYMNAAILGVKKKEIDNKASDIIQFADIGDFINQPVKTYSSGMFVRLAFAVAINVDADIIIIDEALAVGDIFFRQKCYSKLNEIKAQGKTIILVSHAMNEVEQFCDRALLINQGKQIALDKSHEVVQQYYMLNQESRIYGDSFISTEKAAKAFDYPVRQNLVFFDELWEINEECFCDLGQSTEHSNGKARYKKIGIFDSGGRARRLFKQGEYVYFYSEVEILEDIWMPISGIVLKNQKNLIIHGKNTFQTEQEMVEYTRKGQTVYNCIKIKLDIQEGEYTFECGFSTLKKQIYDLRFNMPHEELNEHLEILLDRRDVAAFAVQGNIDSHKSKLAFYGLVDLRSQFDCDIRG